ncbi:hypothetical protein CB0940_00363 [Cercospora beticola]|uniref:Tat pathway signal sequence n=1 Tax=Cercospora beticola TaxID=122368 RepID=A0A2G5IAC2_CERBT|nr:hypothetical protein CB0940_00363 [Cercospora beticola]PIB01494.1 hypothetical protein CB0940_00363 [Cercospora beticola]WPA95776.1 hypothetical protein RHO25_000379 [Cercospora beticola]CAK1355972.1 unnamed protein product [Cercospora beticola]
MSYTPLMKNEEWPSQDDYSDDSQTPLNRQNQRPLRKDGWRVVFAVVLAAIVSLTAGVAIGMALGTRGNELLFSQTMAPSPVSRDLDIAFHETQFEGHFMDENIYRLKGNNETDAAWEALGIDYRSMQIPKDVGLSTGLRPGHVQINDKYGGGFPAHLEGLHHLHCLNLVRQALYYNIDYYRAKGTGAFVNDEMVVQKHVSHCLDIVRQQLMCQVDVGVLGQVWWQPKDTPVPEPFVDFNTKHVCRNFEAVRQWAEERQMPIETPDDFLAPPEPGSVLDHMP